MKDISEKSFFSVPDFRKQIRKECAKRSKQHMITNAATFFKSVDGDEYVVSVTSRGTLTIWILTEPHYTGKSLDDLKKRKRKDTESVFQIQVSKDPLLDVINLPKSRLACCGAGGVFILDWEYILANKDEPSITNHIIHLNCSLDGKVPVTSLSAGSGMLFAAASNRMYAWDTEDCELISTFYNGSLPVDSIIVCRWYSSADIECQLTGGADGKVRFWDVHDRSLLHEIDLVESFNEKDEKKPNFSPRINCIQIDDEGSWAIIAGGACSNSTVKDGFVALLNIRTKTVCSLYFTREVIQAVSYHSKGILTVGNEGAVSFWNSFLGKDRAGRFHLSLPSCHCVAVEPITQTVVVGGVGSNLACLSAIYGFQFNTLKYP